MNPQKLRALFKVLGVLVITILVSCKKEEVFVKMISVKTPPTKIVYFDGEKLDLTGIEVIITMDNGDKKNVNYSDFEKENLTVSPTDGTILTSLMTTLKIEHTISGKSTNQSIIVKEIELSNILIKTPTVKLDYVEGEVLNLSGLVLTLEYNNGNKEDVGLSDFNHKGLTTNPQNEAVLTSLSTEVVISHTNSGKNVKQNISVSSVSGIALKTPPVKTEYYKGELLDLSGLEVVLILSNSESVNIAFSDFSKYGLSTSVQNNEELTSEKSSILINHLIAGKNTTLTILVHNVVVDIDGNSYNIVKINKKIWMKENLKVKRYADGTSITLITDNNTWANLNDINTDAAYCYYNNNVNNEADTYGALYTYAAAVKGTPYNITTKINIQGVCPTGWHIPSSNEWDLLFAVSGGSLFAGKDLKEAGTLHWISPNSGANDKYGFTALPGGERESPDGLFDRINTFGAWWTSQEINTNYAWRFSMYNDSESANPYTTTKSTGSSVRCIKD